MQNNLKKQIQERYVRFFGSTMYEAVFDYNFEMTGCLSPCKQKMAKIRTYSKNENKEFQN